MKPYTSRKNYYRYESLINLELQPRTQNVNQKFVWNQSCIRLPYARDFNQSALYKNTSKRTEKIAIQNYGSNDTSIKTKRRSKK